MGKDKPPLRPLLEIVEEEGQDLHEPEDIKENRWKWIALVKSMWDDNSDARPTMKSIIKNLNIITKYR